MLWYSVENGGKTVSKLWNKKRREKNNFIWIIRFRDGIKIESGVTKIVAPFFMFSFPILLTVTNRANQE